MKLLEQACWWKLPGEDEIKRVDCIHLTQEAAVYSGRSVGFLPLTRAHIHVPQLQATKLLIQLLDLHSL